MNGHANELSTTDWLQRIPARSLAYHVTGPGLQRQLAALPTDVYVADVQAAVEEPGSSLLDLSEENQVEASRAIRVYRRSTRTRKLEAIRPANPSWAIPDEVGFKLEGTSSQIGRRRTRLLAELAGLRESAVLDAAQERAVGRVSEVLHRIQSFPNFIYWYSPTVVNKVRRAAPQTLQEVNLSATYAVKSLGIECSISTWEDNLGVVSRRIPLGVVTVHLRSRKARNLIRQLESLGVKTLGGLAVASRDSSFFLGQIQMRTLQNLALALKGVHRQQES